MRRICMVLLCLPLLLTGCGRARRSEALQQRYAALVSAELTAEVTCHLPGEVRPFTLSCDWTPAEAEITVTAPAELAGLSAAVSGEDLALRYEDLVLPAGTLTAVTAANCLPWLLRSAASGYVLEEGEEKLGDTSCLRVAFDTTAPDGEKVLCTVWFDGAEQTPLYAEFTADGQLTLSAVIRSFSGQWAGE
ncbi:MAG: hypothetical protein E7426_02565 [Ruminococcaceae bacterium]|nr:hypothetical protein [Oscillospiraceae bacterium]